MNTVRIPRNSKVCIQKVEIIETPNSQSFMNAPKRMKLNNPSSTEKRPAQSVVLNSIINLNSDKTNRDTNTHHTMATEDFFLKNENNCFYKCVFCSETIKSKPSYKTHIHTTHGTTVNKYHIQKGFIDATKEFCTEFVQTDFNIIHSLTSIFDHIDNIDRIIRDHKKRFRCDNLYAYAEDPVADTYLKDEVVVLKLYGEMIQRAFDILSEKNELIVGLQDDVTQLLEQDDSFNHQKQSDKNDLDGGIVKEEEEPTYELYYVEDDPNQQKCDSEATGTSTADKIDFAKTNTNTSTTTRRGRPKGDSARSLEECLAELPVANAEYIRSMTANSDAKYQCDTCDVSAKTKMLLCVHHMRVHLKRKDKVCPHCDRAFASQGDLTRHIRIHSGECPFKCNYEGCTSEFKTSGDLKKHSIVHSSIPMHRPFECSECESKFARQTDLTRHKKIHLIGKEGNVGFTCELCNRVFYRKDLFRAHENHHLNIRPFECTHCLKRFAKKFDLLKHIDKQHKAVDCDKCGDTFESRSKLIGHFRSGTCKDVKS